MDLGLELLMNPRKKSGSDNGSVASADVQSVRSVKLDIPYAHSEDNVTDVSDEILSVERINVNEFNDRSETESQLSFRSRESRESRASRVSKSSHKQKKRYQSSMSSVSESEYTETEECQSEMGSLGSMLASGEKPRTRMSEEDVFNAKKELLYQFDRLEKKGMKLPKKFTMSSNLDEMRQEYERLKRDKDLDNAVKFQRRALMMFTSGVEFLNSKFDPFDVKLDGWSESVHENIVDYDDVFEELYDKYKGKAKMAPELKLLFALGGSAFMFHMTNSMFKQVPGLDQVLKQNPDLMKQFAAATANTMKSQQPQGGLFSGITGMFSSMFGGGGGSPVETGSYVNEQPVSFNMKGPSNIDDIMRELENNDNDNDRIEVMSTVSSSEFTELQDDVSINNLVYNKKKGGKKMTLDL
jgi:predicted DNA-binding WGR domain protein